MIALRYMRKLIMTAPDRTARGGTRLGGLAEFTQNHVVYVAK
jgi:hypothetical protein